MYQSEVGHGGEGDEEYDRSDQVSATVMAGLSDRVIKKVPTKNVS